VPPPPVPDPTLVRRARIRRLTEMGQWVGYAVFGLAVVLFMVGVIVGLSGLIADLVIACLVVGTVVLAPAIVLGYAVKAAEREDRERGAL
jgi:protein-S-isoprenylcysteine O-methyltransferase Ste14